MILEFFYTFLQINIRHIISWKYFDRLLLAILDICFINGDREVDLVLSSR